MAEMKRWLLATALLAMTTAAQADDWPQWLGPKRDGVWRETGIIEKFPDGGPVVRWRAPVAAGYAGPAVADGRVFVMDRVLAEGAKNHPEPFPQRPRAGIPGVERVLCFNEADGKLLWKHEYDCPYMVSYPLGPRCTPTVSGGRVYALGAEGNLTCLAAADGKVVWSHDFKKEYDVKAPIWGFSAHPLIDGNKVITLVGGDGSVVVAFDKDSGKEIWRNLSSSEAGYSPPVIYEANGQRQLLVWDPEAIHGLDPESGKVLWSHPAETYRGMSVSMPLVFGNQVFITGYPKTAALLRLKTDPPAAEVVWTGVPKKTAFYSVFSTPQFEDGYLYGVHDGGKLCCIKADTGERVWESLQAHGRTPAPSAEVFLIKNGDRFFLFNEKGDLIIAKLSPKAYEEISRAHVIDPSSSGSSSGFSRQMLWSPPAFANRCAYVRNDNELICVSLAK
jgi:outer membrane protein assembly factor BamB